MDRFQEAFSQLQQYVEAASFKGYDPYDVLKSPIPFNWAGKWGPILAIQFHKRNPVNLRQVLGIPKGHNPKGLGLFLQGYAVADGSTESMERLLDLLFSLRTKGQEHHCWGYDFPWASPVKFLPAWSPTIVVTGFVAQGLYAYFTKTQDPKALECLNSISRFMEALPRSENEHGICFSYSTAMQDVCFNASMLGAEHFARMSSITGNQQHRELALEASRFTVANQAESGAWPYSLDRLGQPRQQIDFHQGFVLCSLLEVIRQLKKVPDPFHSALNNGAEFYLREQFTAKGRSLWRWPKAWPTDIHHQAQGIITFSRLTALDDKYLTVAERIADWTLANMRAKDGSFYYRVHGWGKDRSRYMRWGQAWMFLALAELNQARKGK